MLNNGSNRLNLQVSFDLLNQRQFLIKNITITVFKPHFMPYTIVTKMFEKVPYFKGFSTSNSNLTFLFFLMSNLFCTGYVAGHVLAYARPKTILLMLSDLLHSRLVYDYVPCSIMHI